MTSLPHLTPSERELLCGACGGIGKMDDSGKACPSCGGSGASDSASFDVFPALLQEVGRLRAVTNEIVAIMQTYDEQEASGHIGTPGGLEHMGDVWRLLRKWRAALAPRPVVGENGDAA